MLTDEQFQRILRLSRRGITQENIADRVQCSSRTVRTHLKSKKLPSETKKDRTYKTRANAFDGVWSDVIELLETNPGIQAQIDWVVCGRCCVCYNSDYLRKIHCKSFSVIG